MIYRKAFTGCIDDISWNPLWNRVDNVACNITTTTRESLLQSLPPTRPLGCAMYVHREFSLWSKSFVREKAARFYPETTRIVVKTRSVFLRFKILTKRGLRRDQRHDITAGWTTKYPKIRESGLLLYSPVEFLSYLLCIHNQIQAERTGCLWTWKFNIEPNAMAGYNILP